MYLDKGIYRMPWGHTGRTPWKGLMEVMTLKLNPKSQVGSAESSSYVSVK